ncbi:MAG: SDR family oxidoreductase [Actinomycetota bacterium]
MGTAAGARATGGMTARVLVTGGSGFIGSQVVARLAASDEVDQVVSVDIAARGRAEGVRIERMDVRDPGLVDLIASEGIDRVVHLAAVVTPRPDHTREFLYSVDVEGTANVVEACLAGGVRHLVVTSSGAAYGYHPDNPLWIDEDHPLRGNPGFAYSDHKRIVEENLEKVRSEHPELGQLVLRPGTILGETVDNQITALFERPVVLGIAGAETLFVFIWDTDVVDVVVAGTLGERTGIYNLAGDGAVPLRDIARELGKPYLPVPTGLVKGVLWALRRLRLTGYGPEQVDFLRYRPVLSNRRLVEEFGYTPSKTSAEALRAWAASRG